MEGSTFFQHGRQFVLRISPNDSDDSHLIFHYTMIMSCLSSSSPVSTLWHHGRLVWVQLHAHDTWKGGKWWGSRMLQGVKIVVTRGGSDVSRGRKGNESSANRMILSAATKSVTHEKVLKWSKTRWKKDYPFAHLLETNMGWFEIGNQRGRVEERKRRQPR